ncbi:hypothetical protein CPB85DRAFT_1332072, partial [Mucidula mucida]
MVPLALLLFNQWFCLLTIFYICLLRRRILYMFRLLFLLLLGVNFAINFICMFSLLFLLFWAV